MTTETLPAVREAPQLTPFEVIEKVVSQGDIAKMTPAERVAFYWRTCESLGLNPLTRPFEFINLNNRLVMYARKDATDQLRSIRGVTVTNLRREKDDDLGLYTVEAYGRDRTGREDAATGVVNIKGLGGEALANAVMKAETKAKRRLTLSLCGLGFLDESEIEGAEAVEVDPDTGEIRQPAKPASLLDQVKHQRAVLAGTTEEVEGEATEAETAPTDTADLLEGLDEETAAAAAEPLSYDALKDALRERRIPITKAVEVTKRLFPGTAELALLDDAQRGQVLAELTRADG